MIGDNGTKNILTKSEKSVICQSLSYIRTSFISNKQQLTQQMQHKLHKQERTLHKAIAQFSTTLSCLTSTYEKVDSILTQILETNAIQKSDSHPFTESLIRIKSRNEALTYQTLLELITQLGLSHPKSAKNPPQLHCLSVYLGDAELSIYTKQQNSMKIQHSSISPYSRCLALNEDLIVLSGGLLSTQEEMKNVSLISITNKTVTQLPCLKTGRYLHAMAFIDNNPAVIGGYSKHSLTSVEMLENGQ